MRKLLPRIPFLLGGLVAGLVAGLLLPAAQCLRLSRQIAAGKRALVPADAPSLWQSTCEMVYL